MHTSIHTSLARHSSELGSVPDCGMASQIPWASLWLVNHSNIRNDNPTHKNGRVLVSKKPAGRTTFWEHKHLSPTFATVIKHRATAGKNVTMAVTCADANALMNKHCPAYLVNGMFRKIPAFLGLNHVAEVIFMLQMKGSELIAWATLKELQQHLVHLSH